MEDSESVIRLSYVFVFENYEEKIVTCKVAVNTAVDLNQSILRYIQLKEDNWVFT